MIAIVDYGLGNIKAFSNIYKRLNIPHGLASTSEDLSRASKIILPGVGAFDYAMEKLNNSGLRSVLESMVLEKNVPIIGICVGMQMMAESSEEGSLKGLGWVPGHVKKLRIPPSAAERFPLPHMGWNNLQLKTADPLFVDLDKDPRFYFLHSYYFETSNPENVIATAEYGEQFSCIVKNKNVYGIQCHPEKSHHSGVSILKNFASL